MTELDACARLSADLQAALDRYVNEIPTTEVQAILARFRERAAVERPTGRLGRAVAADVVAALTSPSFIDQLGDRLAELVSEQVRLEFEPYSLQGWWRQEVTPPWSGYCHTGQHGECNGTAPPAESGCHCPHHAGQPIGDWTPDEHYQRDPDPGSGDRGEVRHGGVVDDQGHWQPEPGGAP